MVESVEFPKNGSGYIYDKIEKPGKPQKGDREYVRATEEEFQKALKDWEQEVEQWKALKEKHKNPMLYKCLAGKKFEFATDKINIIFGPNGCGKTTILRAIGGEAFTKDGFTDLLEPINFSGWDNEYTDEQIEREVTNMKRNTCTVNWTGNPLYYDNFNEKLINSGSYIGSLVGSALGGFGDEMQYRVVSKRLSAGQNVIYIFNKVIRLSNNNKSVQQMLLEKYGKDRRVNDTWRRCWDNQIDYIVRHHPDTEYVCPMTFLFDEMDKSLDIETVCNAYLEFFPTLIEKTKCQVITVSHNPIVLSKQIYDNEKYNIISLDEDYTKRVKALLSDKIQF